MKTNASISGAVTTGRRKIKKNKADRIFNICNTIFMLFIIIVMLYPFLNTLLQIILPICKPVPATVCLWIAVGNRNDRFTSFI